MSEHGTDSPGNEAGIDPAWADIDTLDERLRIALTWVPGVRRDAALRTLDALTERAKQAVDREVSVRYCLNVHGDMLCNGPQGHEGGCVFEPGWMLARRIEDDCVSIAAYAGDTTNELRETRDEVERDRRRDQLEGRHPFDEWEEYDRARAALAASQPAEKEGWGSMDLLTGGTAPPAEEEGT